MLTVPVSRLRLLLVKYAAIAVYALVAALVVAGVGILVGSLLFPIGPVPLLSGDVLPYSTALVRALLVALYVGAMLAGVAAIGLFISTLTEVPLGAMAATAAVCVVAQILDAIPQLSWLHDWLFSHWWLAFGDLLHPGGLRRRGSRPADAGGVHRRVLLPRLGPLHHPRRHVLKPSALVPGGGGSRRGPGPEAGPSRYASADVIRPDGRSRPAGPSGPA